MTPEELRADIPALDRCTYLNTGASGPSPRRVLETAVETQRAHEYDEHHEPGPYAAAGETLDAARERIAAFLGVSEGELALTESTTDGINRVATAVGFEPGDVVVRTDLEHPAGILPWERLEAHAGVEVRVVETNEGRVDRGAYAEAVSGARLVCFSALTWTHGTLLPVRDLVEIARDAGAFTLVDGVQVPGQRALDLPDWGADAVAGAGHKWLLSPFGSGFLYVREGAIEELVPASVGFKSVREPYGAYDLAPDARRFEVGTTNVGAHAALAEATAVLEEIGMGGVEARIEGLTTGLKEQVPKRRMLSPETFESGLVTVGVDDPEGAVERLDEQEIVVRTVPGVEGIRVSLHVFNAAEDVDALCTALAEEW
ncbi:aminotransferase class V-fold PLP-dependent enzyme [Natronorarus salvus]|uniref:aminotransferase class V-fold PLP-dependent enzyme n=1 Tax=Natronorarus salvus TaxID=3117733 RepID=UPI002F261455